MSIKDILHQAPWNRKRRLEFYRIKKELNKLLSNARSYHDTFKFKMKESVKSE